jgi:hypothetical protein
MAELEKELGLALEEEQVKSLFTSDQPPQVLALSRHHRTKSRVGNVAKPLVADQKSCEILLDVVSQLRALSSRSSGRLRWW